jgi:hypothetical protein
MIVVADPRTALWLDQVSVTNNHAGALKKHH